MHALLALVGAALLAPAGASKWTLDTEGSESFLFTELYMYGSHDGPMGTDGKSYIELDVEVSVPGAEVEVVFFRNLKPEEVLQVPSVCQEELPNVDNVQRHYGTSPVQLYYEVPEGGQYEVYVLTCRFTPVKLTGSLTFHNPYGYLPAIYFPYLPFSLALCLTYVLFGVCFAAAYFRHTVIKLQAAVLAVVVLSAVEAFSWFYAFWAMNDGGDAPCCPMPTSLVASGFFNILSKIAARVLLLGVALGLGVQRQSLPRAQVVGIVLLSVAYVSAATYAKMAETLSSANAADASDSESATTVASLPQLFCDVAFILWTFNALMATQHELRETGQTYKLAIYDRLTRTIVTFVMMFTALTFASILAELGIFAWPWYLVWTQGIFWRVLTFAVIAAICVLWRPTENSATLALMEQVGGIDRVDDDGEEEWDPEDGIEMAPARPAFEVESDSSDSGGEASAAADLAEVEAELEAELAAEAEAEGEGEGGADGDGDGEAEVVEVSV